MDEVVTGLSPIGQEADVGKGDPVIMIGIDKDGVARVVGLYETAKAAHFALQLRETPRGLYYSLMTPAMNTCREIEVVPTTSTAGR